MVAQKLSSKQLELFRPASQIFCSTLKLLDAVQNHRRVRGSGRQELEIASVERLVPLAPIHVDHAPHGSFSQRNAQHGTDTEFVHAARPLELRVLHHIRGKQSQTGVTSPVKGGATDGPPFFRFVELEAMPGQRSETPIGQHGKHASMIRSEVLDERSVDRTDHLVGVPLLEEELTDLVERAHADRGGTLFVV